jgi:hypothetical protein
MIHGMQTISFPDGAYSLGRCVYIIQFADNSVYVGITGTSNNTGISTPAERIGLHLKKRGNTRSAMFDKVSPLLRNKRFTISYDFVPDEVLALAPHVEHLISDALRQRYGYRILNEARLMRLSEVDGKSASAWAKVFLDKWLATRLHADP